MLVALDVDGTLIHDDESASERTIAAVRSAVARGHELMLATGRSWETAHRFQRLFGLESEYVVCSNGAVTLKRDAREASGYRREFVETFDATEVLSLVRDHLPAGRFMVEDASGYRRYTEVMEDWNVSGGERVGFDELSEHLATRVVVVSPDHGEEEFLAMVERMGLHRVSYSVGWTAWLDIAPEGINKATALERVRGALGISSAEVVAIGDGRNDLEMFAWARRGGRAVAMGQAPDEVKEAASTITASVADDGVALVLDAL